MRLPLSALVKRVLNCGEEGVAVVLALRLDELFADTGDLAVVFGIEESCAVAVMAIPFPPPNRKISMGNSPPFSGIRVPKLYKDVRH
jgi:hypothetical protein